MPVPIMPIPDNRNDFRGSIDYSFLFNQPSSSKKKVIASDKDAKILFDLWTKGKKGNYKDEIIVDSSLDISSRDIMRLKTKGFLTGGTKEVKFTNRGKTVISTMALGEVNRFEKKKQDKSYTEILASMDKRGKKGYRVPKYASNTSNNINLKQAFNISPPVSLDIGSAKPIVYKYVKENDGFPSVEQVVELMKSDPTLDTERQSEEMLKATATTAINYWMKFMESK